MSDASSHFDGNDSIVSNNRHFYVDKKSKQSSSSSGHKPPSSGTNSLTQMIMDQKYSNENTKMGKSNTTSDRIAYNDNTMS